MATVTSVQSGLWSSGSTWNTGNPPAAGDQVVISSGHTVTYDVVEGSSLDVELGVSASSVDIDIYGTLQFDTSATQPLRLRYKGLIQIRGTGKFICGTETNPMPVRVTIQKTAAGGSMMSVAATGGELSFVGSPNVPYDSQEGWYRFVTKLASAASSGATTITVVDNLNWGVGDVIVMPQLPAAEAPSTATNPFIATVTNVSGNTLTLSAGLPHAYPAGAEVAKVNRSIVLRTATTSGAHVVTAASGQTIRVTGLKWLSFLGSGSNHLFYPVEFHNLSVIEYVSYPPNYSVYPHLGSPVGSVPRIKCCFGNMFQFSSPHIATHEGGVICGAFFLAGGYTPPLVENARVWNAYAYGNNSQKVVFKNCVFTNFVARASMAYHFENCIFYGYTAMTNYGTTVTYITTARNCKFYPLSQLGYSTTYRCRFDWGSVGGVILANYIDCEFYGTWVEPSTFQDWAIYRVPRARFINKKVGATTIPFQEFTVGGIITADTTDTPSGSNLPYTLKFEPKNANLPLAYNFLIPPRQVVSIYFKRTSAISYAKARVIEIKDEFVSDPTTPTPISEIDLASYPADTWLKLEITNPTNNGAVLQVLVKGTSGELKIGFSGIGVAIQEMTPLGGVDSLLLNLPMRIVEVQDLEEREV